MNIELATIGFKKSDCQINNIEEDTLELTFGDTKITLSAEHKQDCCEKVYAEFDIMEYHKKDICNYYYNYYNSLTILSCEGMGIILDFKKNDFSKKILIPCHNEQNGYYSDKLDLKIIIESKGIKVVEKTIDISECEQNKIN